MSPAEIFDEIKHLPWSPDELTKAAAVLAAETDPEQSAKLTERIVAGFFAEPYT